MAVARTNSSIRACSKNGDPCGNNDDDEGLDLIKNDIPDKPSSDLGATLDGVEDWNELSFKTTLTSVVSFLMRVVRYFILRL